MEGPSAPISLRSPRIASGDALIGAVTTIANMNVYLHTQRAGRWLIVPLVASAGMVLAATLTGLWAFLLGVPLLGIIIWQFAYLTIEIRDAELRWRFGPGLIRKRVRLAEVERFEPVATSFGDGWGVHSTENGWLYNVAGFTAVAIQLRNGVRFALGTDDPVGLMAALTTQLSNSSRHAR